MVKKSSDNSSAVKIDSGLLEKVERFIERDENRLKYNNKKQFIDIVVNEFLKKEVNINDKN